MAVSGVLTNVDHYIDSQAFNKALDEHPDLSLKKLRLVKNFIFSETGLFLHDLPINMSKC